MKKRKDETLRDFVNEQLKDSRFREAYEEATLALNLAEKITSLRKKLRMTQSELARRMGTKQQAISRLENGDYEGFTLKTLEKIAAVTDTELEIQFRSKKLKKAS
jgi:DNA-binding XRE family transcriptional regulator